MTQPEKHDPWAPPKATLELPKPPKPPEEIDDSKGALRAMLFAPAVVVGPIAIVMMLFAGGSGYFFAAGLAFLGYLLYRRR